MKRIATLLGAIALVMFTFAACTEPSSDETAKNKDLTLVTASEISSEAGTGCMLLHVTLTSADNTAMVVTFGNDGWLLKPASYSSVAADPGAGKYTATIGGAAVTRGMLTVAGNVEKYTISGIVETGETRWDVKYEGPIAFEDKAPVQTLLTQVFTEQVSSATLLTIKVGTDGVSCDKSSGSEVYDGTGYVLSLDIYTPDGYLHEGTYKPCAKGGEVGEGEYGIGWDPGDLYGIGMVFENWGTCWWNMKNGVAVDVIKIIEGNITVTKDENNVWTISYGESGDDVWCSFTGELPLLTKVGDDTPLPDASTLIEANALVGWNDNTASQWGPSPSYTFYFASGVTVENMQVAGSGYMVVVELYVDGGLALGNFAASASVQAIEAGQFRAGGDNGWGGTAGTYIATYTNGRQTGTTTITDGTVKVSKSGDDLVVEIESTNAKTKSTFVIPEGCTVK